MLKIHLYLSKSWNIKMLSQNGVQWLVTKWDIHFENKWRNWIRSSVNWKLKKFSENSYAAPLNLETSHERTRVPNCRIASWRQLHHKDDCFMQLQFTLKQFFINFLVEVKFASFKRRLAAELIDFFFLLFVKLFVITYMWVCIKHFQHCFFLQTKSINVRGV